MNAVPDEKQGVASAVNDATRGWRRGRHRCRRDRYSPPSTAGSSLRGLAGFPDQVREAALESLAQALAVAGELGPQGARLAEDLAESAFIESMDLSLFVLAILLAVAADVRRTSGRRGATVSSSNFVQRFTARWSPLRR